MSEPKQTHDLRVIAFLTELYCIMVDPLAEGDLSVADLTSKLREAALRSREDAAERAASAEREEAVREVLAKQEAYRATWGAQTVNAEGVALGAALARLAAAWPAVVDGGEVKP